MALSYAQIAVRASASHLAVLGGFATAPDDPVPTGTRALVLLGPKEPGFWAYVTAQSEFGDGMPDPLDRWSATAIGGLATAIGAQARFPFGQSPPAPFVGWALRTGAAWVSPVNLLVHAEAGLLVSFRGALALPWLPDFPPPVPKPCDVCLGKPCLTACPVGALDGQGYDLAACHRFLDTDAGRDCMAMGCAVRRACPISQRFARNPAQSAYHMTAFHK